MCAQTNLYHMKKRMERLNETKVAIKDERRRKKGHTFILLWLNSRTIDIFVEKKECNHKARTPYEMQPIKKATRKNSMFFWCSRSFFLHWDGKWQTIFEARKREGNPNNISRGSGIHQMGTMKSNNFLNIIRLAVIFMSIAKMSPIKRQMKCKSAQSLSKVFPFVFAPIQKSINKYVCTVHSQKWCVFAIVRFQQEKPRIPSI